MKKSEYEKIKNPDALIFLDQQERLRRRRKMQFLRVLPVTIVLTFVANYALIQAYGYYEKKHHCGYVCGKHGFREATFTSSKSGGSYTCTCTPEANKPAETFEL